MKRSFISIATTVMLILSLSLSLNVSAAILDSETENISYIESEYSNNFSISDAPADNINSVTLFSNNEFDEIEPSEYMGRKIISEMANGDFLLKIYDKMVECGESVCDLTPEPVTLSATHKEYQIFANEQNRQIIMEAYHNDYPQHFYYNSICYAVSYYPSTGKYVITFIPMIDKIEISTAQREAIIKMRDAFEKRVSQLIEKLGISNDMSDFEKAVILHDELLYSIDYEDVENSHNAYGAIIGQGGTFNKAVCEGYARAYQYLLYKVGVLSHIATGTGNGGAHAWNYVCIGGKWYHTDLTWDDPVGASDIFYNYFDLTTEQIENLNHEVDMLYPEIECTNTDDNYYKKYNCILYSEYSNTDISDGEDALLQSIATQLESSNRARIYNADSMDGDSILNWLKANYSSIKEMINDDSVKEKLSNIQVAAYANGECHLIFFDINYDQNRNLKSSVTADKNGYVSIINNSENTLKLLRIFYNNGIITDTEICEVSQTLYSCLNLQRTILHKEYDDIKYFLWDKETGFIPICNMYEVKY